MLTEDEFTGFLLILGRRIKAIRKEKKLTMRDIMISARYYDAQWRKYEGGSSMNVRALLQIALALDVTLSELLGPLAQWPHKSVAEIVAMSEMPQTPSAFPELL